MHRKKLIGSDFILISLSAWLEKYIKNKQIFLLCGLYIIIVAIMGIVIIPNICKNTGSMTIFDLKATGYDINYAKDFINAMGVKGRGFYLKAQLPLDFIYPFVYGLLYLALANKAFKKLNIPVFASIMILCIADYAENILTYVMLLSHKLSPALVSTASVFTAVKTDFLYVTLTMIAFGAILRLIKKNRGKIDEKIL
ncbi:MAG: hypothetical protein WCN92_05655 [Eubacteriales bacterium]